MKIELQHNPGMTWRFDYPGWGGKFTLDDGSILHIHHDIDNGTLIHLRDKDGKTVLDFEGNCSVEEQAEFYKDKGIEVKALDVDWSEYWYVDQTYRD